ncbi:MAG: DNA/RNA non-specific endonuclease [Bacteroidota bacterium]|nr:DNA/RNA non-specific endonuclease [Bacteroidota bacterium]
MNKKAISVIIVTALAIALYFLIDDPLNLSTKLGRSKRLPPVIISLSTIESGYPSLPYDSSSVLKYLGFHLSYNEEFEQANWTAYILTREMVENGQFERTNNFRADTNISTLSASLADYRKSGFDRGHLVPAGDMKWNEQAMSESFLMSNISPQVPGFNRNLWKKLETKVRKWTVENDSLFIITGPVLQDIDQFIGKNNVGVPHAYFKLILDISAPDYKGIAFFIENKASSRDIFSYAISIDSLEVILNNNFFPDQESYSIEFIESRIDVEDWR